MARRLLYIVPADSRHRAAPHPDAGSAAATDTIAIHDRSEPLVPDGGIPIGAGGLPAGWRRPGRYRRVRTARRLHDHVGALAGSLRLRRARAGSAYSAWMANISPTGRIPVMHPRRAEGARASRGRDGVYQMVEVVQQLRGECGETQVADARIGMAQNIGGSGATIVTHILKGQNKNSVFQNKGVFWS